jgi:hypothetical protein
MNRILSAIKGNIAKEPRINVFDIFILVNIVLFILMCIFAYYDRFISYRGSENVLEFFIYAVFILLAVASGWIYFRTYRWSLWEVSLIEIGIIMHFSGGLVHIDGQRLYDNIFFLIRYDKYVHFINSFIAAMITSRLLKSFDFKMPRFEGLVIILIVLGGGAIIEIIEYMVVLTVPGNGVGGYDNNMQDLMGNLAGSSVYIILRSLKSEIDPLL